jgi:uncharacterized protein (DUF983 family)
MGARAAGRQPSTRVDPRRVGLMRMLGRALLRRCPRCGGKAWFTGWFRRVDRCQTCGYRYERAPGFVLGEVTINTIVTFGLLAVVLVVGILTTYPDVPLVPLMLAGIAVGFIVPIVFYPFSSTVWAAVDLAMHPLDAEQVADAEAHAAARAADGPSPTTAAAADRPSQPAAQPSGQADGQAPVSSAPGDGP